MSDRFDDDLDPEDDFGRHGRSNEELVDDDDYLSDPEGPAAEDRDREHEFPIHGYHNGEPIPALELIPRERWREVMAPLRPVTRRAAVNGVQYEEVSAALALVGELELEDAGARAAAIEAPPPTAPAASLPQHPSRAPRQINFRLGPDQYERLVRAARLYAMRPATLARVMTVAGVDRALYEERRAREQERSRWRT